MTEVENRAGGKVEPSLAARAYGVLWRSITDNAYANEARRVLRDGLGEEDRRRGIAWAVETYGVMSSADLAAADIRAEEFPRRMYAPADPTQPPYTRGAER